MTRLIVDAEVLGDILDLGTHGITITGAGMIARYGTPYVTLTLQGEGLPSGDVNAVMRRLDDGRTVLAGIHEIGKAP